MRLWTLLTCCGPGCRHSLLRDDCAQLRDAETVSQGPVGTTQQGFGKSWCENTEFAAAVAAERADLAETGNSLASFTACQAASKSCCARVASNPGTSVGGLCTGVEGLGGRNAGSLRSNGRSQRSDVFTAPGDFMGWLTHDDRT